MTKEKKIALTFIVGVIGIGLSTLYFGEQDYFSAPFWAEFAKWIPGILVSILAFWAAQDAKDTGDRAEGEARGARERTEDAEHRAEQREREREMREKTRELDREEREERLAAMSARERRRRRRELREHDKARDKFRERART